MTFKNIFGVTPKTQILDFLADHPSLRYNINRLKRNVNIALIATYADSLVRNGLVKMKDSSYQINTDNPIIQSVLKHDFDEASKVADKESKKSGKKSEGVNNKK